MVNKYSCQILGLNNGCTKQDAKKAARELSIKYHPDKFKTDNKYEKQLYQNLFPIIDEFRNDIVGTTIPASKEEQDLKEKSMNTKIETKFIKKYFIDSNRGWEGLEEDLNYNSKQTKSFIKRDLGIDFNAKDDNSSFSLLAKDPVLYILTHRNKAAEALLEFESIDSNSKNYVYAKSCVEKIENKELQLDLIKECGTPPVEKKSTPALDMLKASKTSAEALNNLSKMDRKSVENYASIKICLKGTIDQNAEIDLVKACGSATSKTSKISATELLKTKPLKYIFTHYDNTNEALKEIDGIDSIKANPKFLPVIKCLQDNLSDEKQNLIELCSKPNLTDEEKLYYNPNLILKKCRYDSKPTECAINKISSLKHTNAAIEEMTKCLTQHLENLYHKRIHEDIKLSEVCGQITNDDYFDLN